MKKLTAASAASVLMAQFAPIALAQEDQGFTGLEEIVVTAQYVEQNVQETPIAITALSGEILEARGQTNTTMIGAQAPNVQLQSGGSTQGNSLIAFIRGVGQQDNSPTLEPGVGIYINDVYYANVQGTMLELLDLERIEILRGPQGTLAGKNSIGGAIKMYTTRPNEELNAFIEVGAGNLGARKVRAATNVTLTDSLFARISGVYNERDGYVDVLDFGCVYPDSGVFTTRTGSDCGNGTLGGIENTAGRIDIEWTPSDTFALNFTADVLDESNEAATNILAGYGPTLAPIFSAPPGPTNPLPLAWPWVNPGPAANPSLPPSDAVPVLPSAINPCVFITIPGNPNACFDQQAALGGPIINDGYTSFGNFVDAGTGFAPPRENTMESQVYSLNMDWDISENSRIESITSYRTYEVTYSVDEDGSPFAVSTQFNTQDHESYSQEFRLNSKISDSLSYVLGAFYQKADTDIGGQIGLSNNGLYFLVDDNIETESVAFFANAIWAISDSVEFSGGIRYSDDEKVYNFDRLNPDGTSPIACDVIEVAPGVSVVNPTSSPNCLVGGLNDTPAQVFSDDRFDYRAALSYFVSDNATLYASVSTGYKAGGANARPFFAQQLLPHGSEEVTAFEIGGKFEMLDNTLRLNTSVFKNDYKDIIVTLFDCSGIAPPPFGTPCFLPFNLGEADVQGIEFELDWAPIEGLVVDASFGYIDFEYTKVGGSLSVDTQQAYTPDTTWSLGAQYDFNTDFGRITPRIDVYYQDDTFTQPENTQLSLLEARTLVNASVTLFSNDELWQVRAQVDNLTDEYYDFNITDFVAGSGYANSNPAAPRTYMLTVRRNFD